MFSTDTIDVYCNNSTENEQDFWESSEHIYVKLDCLYRQIRFLMANRTFVQYVYSTTSHTCVTFQDLTVMKIMIIMLPFILVQRNTHFLETHCFYVLTWRWLNQVPQKRWHLPGTEHDLMPRNTALLKSSIYLLS